MGEANDTGGNFNYSSSKNFSGDDENLLERQNECVDVTFPEYPVLRALLLYLGYPIVTIGTIGHLLVIAILIRSKSLRRLSLSVYLLVMSIAGLLALYSGLLPYIIEVQTCYHVMLKNLTSEAGCRLQVAVLYFSLQLYSWMEACVAIERLVAIKWPHQYKTKCSAKNNAIVACVLAIILFGLNAIPFASHGYNSDGFCEAIDTHLFNRVWRYIHVAVYSALPVAVMLPCNVVTLYTMHTTQFNSASVKRAKPITVMMVSLNAVFIVTTAPIMLTEWSDLDEDTFSAVQIVWCVCRLVMYAGSSLTFIVYIAVGARFRKAFTDFLRAGKATVERAMSVLSGGAQRGHSAAPMDYSTDATSECTI